MKTKLLTICALIFILNDSAYANNFKNWLNDFGLSKPIVQDEFFNLGITYSNEPSKLIDNLNILLTSMYKDKWSGTRYFIREGCKPRDCGNKGFLWIDLEGKVAIGAILYSNDQILIFSNFFEDTKDFPKEFINTYLNWLKRGGVDPDIFDEVSAIQPTSSRFLNSKNELSFICQKVENQENRTGTVCP